MGRNLSQWGQNVIMLTPVCPKSNIDIFAMIKSTNTFISLLLVNIRIEGLGKFYARQKRQALVTMIGGHFS